MRFIRLMRVRAAGADHVQNGDQVDLLATMTDPQTGEPVALTLRSNARVKDAGRAPSTPAYARDLAILVFLEDAEEMGLASKLGRVYVSLRNPLANDDDVKQVLTPIKSLFDGLRTEVLTKERLSSIAQGAAPDAGSRPKRLAERLPESCRALSLSMAGLDLVLPGDEVDLLWVYAGSAQRAPSSVVLLQKVVLLGIDAPDRATLQISPEEAKTLILAVEHGELTALARHPEDTLLKTPRTPLSRRLLIDSVMTEHSLGTFFRREPNKRNLYFHLQGRAASGRGRSLLFHADGRYKDTEVEHITPYHIDHGLWEQDASGQVLMTSLSAQTRGQVYHVLPTCYNGWAFLASTDHPSVSRFTKTPRGGLASIEAQKGARWGPQNLYLGYDVDKNRCAGTKPAALMIGPEMSEPAGELPVRIYTSD